MIFLKNSIKKTIKKFGGDDKQLNGTGRKIYGSI